METRRRRRCSKCTSRSQPSCRTPRSVGGCLRTSSSTCGERPTDERRAWGVLPDVHVRGPACDVGCACVACCWPAACSLPAAAVDVLSLSRIWAPRMTDEVWRSHSRALKFDFLHFYSGALTCTCTSAVNTCTDYQMTNWIAKKRSCALAQVGADPRVERGAASAEAPESWRSADCACRRPAREATGACRGVCRLPHALRPQTLA